MSVIIALDASDAEEESVDDDEDGDLTEDGVSVDYTVIFFVHVSNFLFLDQPLLGYVSLLERDHFHHHMSTVQPLQ